MGQIVTPLPSIGEVIPGQDVAGRSLRISGHPESDRVVLSIWQDGRCLATVRVARADLPDLTHALVSSAITAPEPDGPHADVVPLPTAATGSPGLADRARTAVTRLVRFTATRR
jgi:hypothetical protein